jgi:hypothetical protein
MKQRKLYWAFLATIATIHDDIISDCIEAYKEKYKEKFDIALQIDTGYNTGYNLFGLCILRCAKKGDHSRGV